MTAQRLGGSTVCATGSVTNLCQLRSREKLQRSAVRIAAVAIVGGWAAPYVVATTPLYWDTNGATTGAGTLPTGTWDQATTANWTTDSTGATATSTWDSGATTGTDTTAGTAAVFSAGADANGTGNTAFTVTVDGTINYLSQITTEQDGVAPTANSQNFVTTLAAGANTPTLNFGSNTIAITTFQGTVATFTSSNRQLNVAAGVTMQSVNTTLALNKSGGGVLQLRGTMAYAASPTDTTIVTNGSSTVPITLTAGLVDFNSLSQLTKNINLSGGGLQLNAGASTTLDNTYAFSALGGALTLNNASSGTANTFVIVPNITLNGTTARTLTIGGANTGTNEVKGRLSQNATASDTAALSLTKADAGTWRLSNDTNNFTGQIQLNNGALEYTTIAASGTNSALGANGTIQLGNATGNNVCNLTYIGTTAGTLSSNRAINLRAGGAINVPTDNTPGNGNSNNINNNGTGTLILSGAITSAVTTTGTATARDFRLGGTNTTQNELQSVIPNGTIPTRLLKADAGRWYVSNAASTFTGEVGVNNGVLEFNTIAARGTASSLGTGGLGTGAIYIGAPTANNLATLRYVGSLTAPSSTSISTDRPLILRANAVSNANRLESDAAGPIVFNGTLTSIVQGASAGQTKPFILGGGNTGDNTLMAGIPDSTAATNPAKTSLGKEGLGTWILGGTSSYTGATTITAGVLRLASTGSIASSPSISIAANATLDVSQIAGYSTSQTLSGNGTVNGSVALASGGKIAPGTSPGVLNFANSLDLSAATSTDSQALVFDIGPNDGSVATPNDKIAVVGPLNVGTLNPGDFNFVPGFPTANVQYTLLTSSLLSGSVDNSSFTLDGFTARLDQSGNNVVLNLTGTPEPGSLSALSTLGVLGLLGRRRRSHH